MRRERRERLRTALLAMVAGVAILGQACGGGSTDAKATPTARPLATLPPGQETPTQQGDFVPGEGTPPSGMMPGGGTPPAGIGGSMMMGDFYPALADLLGISEEDLRAELTAEGATLATVAEAHGRTREELKSFLTEQMRANAEQAVADGSMSEEEMQSLIQDLSSQVDDMIDGNMPFGGGRGPAPPGGPGQ